MEEQKKEVLEYFTENNIRIKGLQELQYPYLYEMFLMHFKNGATSRILREYVDNINKK